MKSFLKYFFITNVVNSVITLVYAIIQTAVITKWQADGPGLSWGLTGFFSGVCLFNVIGEIICFNNLKKQGYIK